MRVILAGSRQITDFEHVLNAIRESKFEITTVLSGGARGVDSLGERWASENNIPVEVYPALWGVHGKRAGRVRNQKMAERADALIAIMVQEGSPGTLDMIDRASAMCLKVYIHLVAV